jgi:hypothetical protein
VSAPIRAFAAALAVAIVGVGTAACGSSGASSNASTCSASTSFPASSLASIAGTSGALHVELRSAPNQPLLSGLDCIELVVTDAQTGAPVDGLTVAMTPWMPAMGHGADVTPQVTALGDGRYVFTDVSLFMPGEWELRTQITGAMTDSVDPTFNVN